MNCRGGFDQRDGRGGALYLRREREEGERVGISESERGRKWEREGKIIPKLSKGEVSLATEIAFLKKFDVKKRQVFFCQ